MKNKFMQFCKYIKFWAKANYIWSCCTLVSVRVVVMLGSCVRALSLRCLISKPKLLLN